MSRDTASVIDEIAAERERQKSVEDWTPEHDDTHKDGQMARAAACYSWAGSLSDMTRKCMSHGQYNGSWSEAIIHRRLWPWDAQWWKPKDKRRDLIRAAALIVAEIERLDRMSRDTGV